jgi:uncharacterized YigZ family protein
MKSIAGFSQVEYIEKKSRFIGLIFHVETVEEINSLLEQAKKDYPEANHYTYAYILDDFQQKYSDDGEPSRTAGYPILEVIKNNNLNDCLIIVIRYFGGILLGGGGLIRAYSHAAALAVKQAEFTKKITTFTCRVTCDYDLIGNIDKIIREQTLLEKVEYSDIVTFYFQVNDFNFSEIKEKIFNHNNYQDKLEIISKKEGYVKVDY